MPQSPDFDFLGQERLYQTLHRAGQNMIKTHDQMRGTLRGNANSYKRRWDYIEDTIEIVMPMPYGHFKVVRDAGNIHTLAAEVMHVMDPKGRYQTPIFETLELVDDQLVLSREFKNRSNETGTGCHTALDGEGLANHVFAVNSFDIRQQPGLLIYPAQVFGTTEYCEAKFYMLGEPGDPMKYAHSRPVGYVPVQAVYREEDEISRLLHQLVHG